MIFRGINFQPVECGVQHERLEAYPTKNGMLAA